MKHLKIHISKLEIDGDLILKDIDCTINANDRISIVGPNGAGKTTLMRILTGEIQNFDGSIDNIGNIKVGYLRQIYHDDSDLTVEQELQNAFTEINQMNQNLAELERKMSEDPEDMNTIEAYTSLLEQI